MTERTYTCLGCNEPKTTDKRKGPIPHRCPECKQELALANARVRVARLKRLRSGRANEPERVLPAS